jgi:bifunctional UDP-N-acetylglucosamine pyrophosphorylase/glucosamine-1-phosphate N-acetyltransferase
MAGPVHQLSGLPAGPVEQSRWTAIIPAAGRGSRLGSDLPKILYPIAGRPILSWLADALAPVCAQYVLVLSAAARPVVDPVAREMFGANLEIAIQDQPTGMADAVRIALRSTRTDFALVVWGDQVALRETTVLACAALHEARPNAALTFPTVLKRNPYIDIERDESGRIVRVRQAREGEIEREIGENDCGLFLFTARRLRAMLDSIPGSGRGALTGETNLLQLLPAFESGPGSVASVRITDADEALGVNTPEDAAAAAKILTARNVNVLKS